MAFKLGERKFYTKSGVNDVVPAQAGTHGTGGLRCYGSSPARGRCFVVLYYFCAPTLTMPLKS